MSLLTGIQRSIATAIVILRTQRLRRWLMFWVTLGALGMVAITVFAEDALKQNPWVLLVVAALCVLLVTFMILLAVYDMLSVMRSVSDEKQELNHSLRQQNQPGKNSGKPPGDQKQ